jgi:hypothetical protein
MATKIEINAQTNEEVERDLTADEVLQLELDHAKYLKDVADQEKSNAAKAIAKQAVLDRLGITADEAALLLG